MKVTGAAYVGTAGWTIPRDAPTEFTGEGSHLQRYARVLRCVEINSTFYRSHRPATWARWAATVPEDFRFAVKAPKAMTHVAKLVNTGAALSEFLEPLQALGEKLGPILLQLPPKLAFDAGVAEEFLTTLRELHGGAAVLEPRHASWFGAEAGALLRRHEVARVAADPARVPAAAHPGGWPGLRYYRLHGSPRTYYSRYDEAYTAALAEELNRAPAGAKVWCVFDNTATGAAVHNALEVQRGMEHG